MLPIHDFQHPRENFASSSHSTPSTSDRHHVDGAGIDHVNETGHTALYRAVLECDETEVERLLNQGAKIGLCDPTTKDSPLHVAAALGNSRILKLLVRAARTQGGNLINLENENGMTPLRVATMHNNAVAVKELLLFKGDRRVARINLNTRCNKQITPLVAAVSKKNLIMVELLADAGADFELRGPDGKTAFHTAAELGSNDLINILWNSAFHRDEKIFLKMLEARDANQDTPLCITAKDGNVDVVKKLLLTESRLKDQPSRCRNGVATLIRAVQRKETYAAQTLLEAASAANLLHIMMDIKDENGNTLLHTAAKNGDQATVRLLLEFDADPFAKNHAGETPFVHALNSLHTPVAHILLEAVSKSSASMESKYRDVKKMTFVRDKLGRTPLEVAIMENDPDLARRIAAIPDNLRYRVLQDQTTMLHLAVKQNRYDVVVILIEAIAAVGNEFNTQFDLINLPDSGRWTPLLRKR